MKQWYKIEKRETEQIMWSLALVSMTQVSTPKAVLFISLVENMECLRLPAKGVDWEHEAWLKATLFAMATMLV